MTGARLLNLLSKEKTMTQFEITKLLYSIYDDLDANVDGIKLKMDSVNDDQIIKIYIEDPEDPDSNHMEKMLSVIINYQLIN